MRDVREAAAKQQASAPLNLTALVNLLEAEGVGTGWVISGAAHTQDLIGKMKIVEPTVSKMQGGEIYSQMNISLNGDESAGAIRTIREKFPKPNFAEDSVMGTVCRELDAKAMDHLELQAGAKPATLPAHFIHLNKALSNILAIPSILLQQLNKQRIDQQTTQEAKPRNTSWGR